jgi:hypothetical protein
MKTNHHLRNTRKTGASPKGLASSSAPRRRASTTFALERARKVLVFRALPLLPLGSVTNPQTRHIARRRP